MRLHFAQTAAGSGHWYPSASWQMHPWCEFQKSYIGLFSSYCIHFQKTWPLTSNPVVWVTDLKSAEIISRNACGINFKILGNFLLESSNSQTWVTTIPYMSSLIELYVANNNRSLQKKKKKETLHQKCCLDATLYLFEAALLVRYSWVSPRVNGPDNAGAAGPFSFPEASGGLYSGSWLDPPIPYWSPCCPASRGPLKRGYVNTVIFLLFICQQVRLF